MPNRLLLRWEHIGNRCELARLSAKGDSGLHPQGNCSESRSLEAYCKAGKVIMICSTHGSKPADSLQLGIIWYPWSRLVEIRLHSIQSHHVERTPCTTPKSAQQKCRHRKTYTKSMHVALMQNFSFEKTRDSS